LLPQKAGEQNISVRKIALAVLKFTRERSDPEMPALRMIQQRGKDSGGIKLRKAHTGIP